MLRFVVINVVIVNWLNVSSFWAEDVGSIPADDIR